MVSGVGGVGGGGGGKHVILGCFKGAFFGVGVLGRIGVCTDETGLRAAVLAVMVLVDACTSLVFLAAGTFPHVPPP